jgi:hypothetical protein
MEPSRRGFLKGVGAALIFAPAVVRSASLMPVRSIIVPVKELPPEADLLTREQITVIRRAFLPRLYVQLYQTNPMFDAIHSGAFG